MVQLKHMQPRVNKQYQKGSLTLCATNLCKIQFEMHKVSPL